MGEGPRSRDARAVGAHARPDDREARRLAERELLDAERDEHEQRAAHRAAPRIRPSAITGNTSR